MTALRSRGTGTARIAAVVALLALTACADDDDDDSPAETPPTLYQETVLRDPTPTTSP
jgi:hypothetical protein